MMLKSVHVPILVRPIVDALIEPFRKLPQEAETHWLVDCTLGGGGHSAALLEAFRSQPELEKHKILALDQDAQAVARGKERFKSQIQEGRIEILQCRFGSGENWIQDRPVLGLMADLGFSSDQLEDSVRGFSFQRNGPLDMRLDSTQGQSCYELLCQISEKELERTIREYGEERFSRRIAGAIVSQRAQGLLPKTTQQLSDLVVRSLPAFARHKSGGRIHPATRTFQALRIAVNDELNELQCLLKNGILSIKPGGRIAILSFHSLEDRRVKLRFREKDLFVPLTKRPMEADEDEIRRNPRARSAKLRIAERVSL